MEYDAVIIGSGLGGLECGAILSKEGWNVCVLEKNRLFGGCLQTFTRYGYSLDTGLHYLGSMEDGQILNQCFRYLGIMDRLRLRKLDEDRFDRIWLGGKLYDYACGPEHFTEVMSGYFPQENDGLREYIGKVCEVGRLVSVENLGKGFVSSPVGLKYMYESASDVICSSVRDSTLRNILSGNALLYGGERDKSTFYEHGMILYSYLEGAYRCVDGCMQIADLLVEEIRRNGGTVLNMSCVDRIAVSDGRVTGVELSDGTFIGAANVISDIHPAVTLSILDRTPLVKPAYRMRVESLDNTYGVFTMYLMMKPGTSPYANYNIYLHRGTSVWYERGQDRFSSCMLSMQASSEDPGHSCVLSVMAPMCMDQLTAWKDTLPGHRGEDYTSFKQMKCGELLGFISECGLGIPGEVNRTFATTPLSYRDFTGTVDGSAYGIIKDWHNPLLSMISPRTKLGNLFFTGQNVNVHGVLGVTLTSVMTCSELLGQEYLTKKIAYV